MPIPRKSADQWFAEYGESHQDDTNELIHWICVPVIFGPVLGLIWSIPLPALLAGPLPWFNWTQPVAFAVVLFYLRLSMPLAMGMFLLISACYSLIEWHAAVCPFAVWKSCLILFGLAWIGQSAATCRLPVATADYHEWNLGIIGTIRFPAAGPQLLTFHYGKGNNFAYFEFEPVDPLPTMKP